jgi:hypothetical protein
VSRNPGQMALAGAALLPPSNFGFLGVHDAQLVRLGALAERYFSDDPEIAIYRLRQIAELLSKRIAATHAVYQDDETFDETLRDIRASVSESKDFSVRQQPLLVQPVPSSAASSAR